MRLSSVLLAAMGTALAPAGALGAGFGINDKSVSSLGSGFSGTAAVAEDASVVYNNPANMLELEGDHLSVGFHRIDSEVSFQDHGSDVKVSGDADAESSTVNYIPNAYYVRDLGPQVRFGFGVYTPFGLDLKWKDDWIGRYQAIDSQITTLNLAPAVAFRASSALTFGASLDVQYLTAELSQAVDYGTLCAAYVAAGFVTDCSGLTPQQSDGKHVLKGDNWAYSFSVGVAYKASEATRMGLVVHGATRHDIHGDSDFRNVPAVFAPMFTDSKGSVTLDLPETVEFGIAHQASTALTLMADYTWTHWSRLDELRVDFDNGLPPSITPLGWRDVGRYALGLHYRFNDRWLARAGFFYDASPVPNASLRTPRTADSDRRGYTIGFNRVLTTRDSIDVAFAYVDLAQAGINNTDNLHHDLNGMIDGEARYFSLQWNRQLR